MKVFDEPLGESNTERRVKISAGISKRRHLILYLLSNLKNFTPGVKILEFKDIKIFQKVKFTRITQIKTFLEGGNFFWGGVQIRGGKIFRPTKMLVFAMVIVFLTFLGLGINSPGGVKTHWVG